MSTAKKLVTGALLLGTLGCNNPKQQNANDNAQTEVPARHFKHAALDMLSHHHFRLMEQDGTDVSLPALEQWMGSNYSTVSFMFNGCSTTCPRVTHELVDLSKRDPRVKHLVISVNPINDKNGLKAFLEANGLTEANTRVLFPIGPQEEYMQKMSNGMEVAAQIQQQMGLLTSGSNYAMHNPVVTVYTPQGTKLMESDIRTLDEAGALSQQIAGAIRNDQGQARGR